MKRAAAGLVMIAGVYLAVQLATGQGIAAPPSTEPGVAAAVVACVLLAALAVLARARSRRPADLVLAARDGSVHVQPEWTASLPFRRRIPVVVQEGQAAVAERRGRFSRVILPGLDELAVGESVGKVIVTRPRKLVASADCITRDGVPVTVELEMEAGVLGAAESADVRGGAIASTSRKTTVADYALLRQSVALAAHQTPGWEIALMHCAHSALLDVVSRTLLNELYDFRGSSRFAFPFAVLADRVRSQVEENSIGWGVTVNRLSVGRVRLPAAIVDKVVSAWIAANPLPVAATAGTSQMESALAGSSGGALRLFPVVGYGPAGSLRELLRHRLGDVAVDVLQVGSDQCVPIGLSGDQPVDYLLRPGVSYFVLRVGPGGITDSAIADGDYVLCEPGDSATDGAVAAIAMDGQIHLGRVARLPDHALLTTDSADRQSVVLAESTANLDAIKQRYEGQAPAPVVRPAGDARVLGQGVVALRRVSSGRDPEQEDAAIAIASVVAPDEPTGATVVQTEFAFPEQGGSL